MDVVFGIPGAHNLDIYDALPSCPGVRHYLARHEQGAAYMADGYARASGRIGVCLTVTGPGVTNALTGLAQAYSDSSPVLLITSQVRSQYVDRDRGLLHELRGQSSLFRTVTLHNERIESVTRIPAAIHEAAAMMRTGRPRPVMLEIPEDVLASWDDVEIPDPLPYERRGCSQRAIEEAVQLLSDARQPVIYAGGGVIRSGASPELVRLAEFFQAPVLTTGMGKGAIPEDHALSYGVTWSPRADSSDITREADVMLAVGTRFSAAFTADWTLHIPERLIHIDIDKREIGKNYPATTALVGDAKRILGDMLGHLTKTEQRPRPSLGEPMQALRESARQAFQSGAARELALVEAIRTAAPRDTIFCADMTVFWVKACPLFPIYEPGTLQFPWGYGTLGFSLPAAIGAKIACPDRPVVVLCGDGAFLYTCQELATAVKYGVKIPIVLFNDNCFGNIKLQQRSRFSGRCSEVDLVNPDFVKFAQSFGMRGLRLAEPSQVRSALAQALEDDALTLIEVPWA
jgi:acetolactate synthase-1/2/3 large subunit